VSEHPPSSQRLPVVALTGCDGSGKSTLTDSLVARLREQAPVESLYLGQSSGRIGEWIRELPLIGGPLGRYLTRKSDRVHDRPKQAPGAVTALAIYLLSRWRAHKYKRMLRLAAAGTLVVTDRYPQAEIPGFLFDGAELAKTEGGSWWVRWLRTRERKLYAWMASGVPMLVIRLNVDEATAHARKPDHKLSSLRAKIANIPLLTFNGATILDLDGRDDPGFVLDASLRAIRAAQEAREA
jgi:thymidylate kinase